MNVRDVKVGDAKSVVELFSILDQETEFMLFEVGERDLNEEDQVEIICNLSEMKNVLLIVSECNGVISGFLGATGEKNSRNKHVVKFAMGVKKEFWRQGAGNLLLESFEKWAIVQGYHRIEMTVHKVNVKAQKLYESFGFEVEGIRKHSLKINNEYVDELYMAKIIGHNKAH